MDFYDARVSLDKSDLILVNEEWQNLTERAIGNEYLEGRCEGYGCDTGCTVYRIYHIKDGKTIGEELGKECYFMRNVALRDAAELGKQMNLPVVMRRDWD